MQGFKASKENTIINATHNKANKANNAIKANMANVAK